ncbi:uncharacterized protein LOC112889240 isoform X2 [Panicum hallii]|uniref:uncharacterized protein LOC112889240 isoform X2 n=1 Tax=Panicum hallii TaxID=206008 RepID=UPI000DF4D72D|nr:uncharacterized protein LOC112889240 isoform X2 [Panicum hallii]
MLGQPWITQTSKGKLLLVTQNISYLIIKEQGGGTHSSLNHQPPVADLGCKIRGGGGSFSSSSSSSLCLLLPPPFLLPLLYPWLKVVGGPPRDPPLLTTPQGGSKITELSMVKKNKVGSADVVYREKYKTWTDDSTEFMLQWYVDYQKDKPATFRWKQHHHHLCVEALNARFGIGATRHQAYRQFRALKEKWNWISQALAKSGNGFDAASRKFNLPYSEKPPSKLGLMEELFGESGQANGSLAIDQYTSDAEDDRSETETDDSFTVEHGENDSDTIARSNSPDLAFSSSLKQKNMKSPMKKLRKRKEKRANALENDKIASSIVMLANSVASSAPAPADPYANLWKRIEDIPFLPRDKVDIATFLSKPEQMYLRNYLNAASDQSFGSWVTDYLGAKYGASGGYACEYGSSK